MMKIRNLITESIPLLVLLGAWAWPVPGAAQSAETPPQAGKEESVVEPSTEAVDLFSDVERILRNERVMELDRAKLEEVREDLEEQQELFDVLGPATYDLSLALEEKQKELEQLSETVDPETRSVLESDLRDLEVDLEFFKKQTDLELTTETSLRQQMASLEKKLERHQRVVDALRGVAPTVSAPSPSPDGVVTPAGTPSVPSVRMPGMPVAADSGAVTEPSAKARRLESTAQVEAERDLLRKLGSVQSAEEAVVEYVKRRESLQEQIDLESVLLDTTRQSVENLEGGLQQRQAEIVSKTEVGADPAEIEPLRGSAERISAALEIRRVRIDDRQEYLASLQERLEVQQQEESLVTKQLGEKRQEVKKAQEKLYWLESPIHPTNVLRWFRERGPRILFVVVVAAVLLLLLKISARTIARMTVRKRRGDRAPTVKRADTLALSFRSAVTLLIVVGGAILVLQEAGIDVKTVLGGAAILGFALAFGAQNLMRDYFTGFMILLEDQYELGDLVSIGDVTGRVEMVNMRTTMLRDLEGRVHFIPNGEVKSVTNRSYVWGRALIEVPVGFKEDVDRVMGVLLEVAAELRTDPEFGPWVTNDPVMLGVDRFTESGIIIKLIIETLPDKMFPVRREMLRRIKNEFDKVGIEISVPYRMLVQPTADEPGPS